MKNSIYSLAVLAIIAFTNFAFQMNGDPAITDINIEKSTVNWKGYKVTGSHTGTINLKEGNLALEDGILKGGRIVIDMNSLATTDLQGEYADKLNGHLKSDDFFGVANFPTATLEITKVAAKGTPGDYKITANLQIKETTKEIKFYANLKDGIATADITIDRSDFNVKYGSGSFFDNLGDKTIYDEFDLNVQLAY